jgi:hypothetical protein
MSRHVPYSALLTIGLLLSSTAFGQSAPPAGDPPAEDFQEVQQPDGLEDIDAILVAGRQPGPGLWKVRSGERTLWILGTQSPLPKRMEWDSANVQRRVGESQELLMPPTLKFDADVGFFRGLTLLPSLLRARRNPDGSTRAGRSSRSATSATIAMSRNGGHWSQRWCCTRRRSRAGA